MSGAVVLDVRGVGISFGGLKAVQGFDLTLHDGDLQGLIGPNGAGKTTIFNLLTGVYLPGAGAISLDGRSLLGLRPHQIARAGLARTFQNIRLFGSLSVLDNVRIATYARGWTASWQAVLRTRAHRAQEAALTERSLELLRLFDLDHRAHEVACTLPYGDQRRLEVARALALEPKVLLLDEPAAGMNPNEKVELRQLIRRIRDSFGLTVLLIEHDMGLVMDICERITVLDHGQIVAVGTPSEVQRDPAVIEAYLGAPGEG